MTPETLSPRLADAARESAILASLALQRKRCADLTFRPDPGFGIVIS